MGRRMLPRPPEGGHHHQQRSHSLDRSAELHMGSQEDMDDEDNDMAASATAANALLNASFSGPASLPISSTSSSQSPRDGGGDGGEEERHHGKYERPRSRRRKEGRGRYLFAEGTRKGGARAIAAKVKVREIISRDLLPSLIVRRQPRCKLSHVLRARNRPRKMQIRNKDRRISLK